MSDPKPPETIYTPSLQRMKDYEVPMIYALRQRMPDDIVWVSKDLHEAEVERLKADRDSWARQSAIQLHSIRNSNSEVERLRKEVAELREQIAGKNQSLRLIHWWSAGCEVQNSPAAESTEEPT